MTVCGAMEQIHVMAAAALYTPAIHVSTVLNAEICVMKTDKIVFNRLEFFVQGNHSNHNFFTQKFFTLYSNFFSHLQKNFQQQFDFL
jgi:hypothetical protein